MQSALNTLVVVRAALICTACDIPVSRKVSGFLGHNALRGCLRCLKPFPTTSFGDKPDYTGFDRVLWESPSNESHRLHSIKRVIRLRSRNILNVNMAADIQYCLSYLTMMSLECVSSIQCISCCLEQPNT